MKHSYFSYIHWHHRNWVNVWKQCTCQPLLQRSAILAYKVYFKGFMDAEKLQDIYIYIIYFWNKFHFLNMHNFIFIILVSYSPNANGKFQVWLILDLFLISPQTVNQSSIALVMCKLSVCKEMCFWTIPDGEIPIWKIPGHSRVRILYTDVRQVYFVCPPDGYMVGVDLTPSTVSRDRETIKNADLFYCNNMYIILQH